MNPLPPPSDPLAQRLHKEAVEHRVASLLASRLNQASETLPHDIQERLRFARQRALQQAARRPEAQQAHKPTVVSQGRGGLALGGAGGWLWRMAAAVPVAALVLGLAGIETGLQQQQITAAAEIDSALLTDDLPPQAYGDPGFQTYLRMQAPQP